MLNWGAACRAGRPWFCVWALVSAVGLCARPVGAQPGEIGGEESTPSGNTQRAEQLAAQANGAYQEGKFNEAIKLYLEAQRLSGSSVPFYNVARIYDIRIHDTALALEFYRKYIVAPDADMHLVQKANARIQAIERARAESRLAPTPAPREATGSGTGPAPTKTEAASAEEPAADRGAQDGANSNTLGYVMLGLGGVGLAAGGVTGIMAMSKASDVEEACVDKTRCDSSNKSTADASETLGIVSTVAFGVGIVGVSIGVISLLSGSSEPAEEPGASVQLVPGLGSVLIQGRF